MYSARTATTTTATTRPVAAMIAAEREPGSGPSSAAAGCGMSLIAPLFDGAHRFASRADAPEASRQERSRRCRYRSKRFIAVTTLPRLKPWLLLPLAGLLLCAHAVKDVLGADAGGFGTLVSAWFKPIAFLACGLAVLWRAYTTRRVSWLLVGAGLTLYAGGNVYYNLAFADV